MDKALWDLKLDLAKATATHQENTEMKDETIFTLERGSKIYGMSI
jgi:hypothetical protein